MAGLLRFVTPDAYVRAVWDVDLEGLFNRGYRGVIVDLDNTLVEWHSNEGPSIQVMAWIRHLKKIGFRACLVSNNFTERVHSFAALLDIPAIPAAGKPQLRGFRKALKTLDVPPEHTVMVGDQLFTDVLGANRLGIYTVLVIPMTSREFLGTRLVRQVERWVLRHLARSGRLSDPTAQSQLED